MAGATPVLADVDPVTRTLDPNAVERVLTDRTKAVIPVHLYGHPASMDVLTKLCEDRGLSMIEDCAQAHGAKWHGQRVGSFGVLSAFSFYPTKNLGAIGDAGLVATNDASLAKRLRICASIRLGDASIQSIARLEQPDGPDTGRYPVGEVEAPRCTHEHASCSCRDIQ